jgi:hypothetical protein
MGRQVLRLQAGAVLAKGGAVAGRLGVPPFTPQVDTALAAYAAGKGVPSPAPAVPLETASLSVACTQHLAGGACAHVLHSPTESRRSAAGRRDRHGRDGTRLCQASPGFGLPANYRIVQVDSLEDGCQ